MINIAVVAEKKLRKYGVALTHSISQIEGLSAALYTPQKFGDNESQITGRNYVIFIGKNETSEPYIDLITNQYEKHGIVWGWSGSKAGVYVKEITIEEDKIKLEHEIIEKGVYSKKEIDEDIVEDIVEGRRTGDIALIFLNALLPGPVILGDDIFRPTKRRITALQYKLGIATFLKEGFAEYIKKADSK